MDITPSTKQNTATFPSAAVIALFVLGCSIYSNSSILVTDRESYRFFPPFWSRFNRNQTEHLGSEYYNIAKAINAGRGFADPFPEPTGPTAWMPPIFVGILAGLHWVTAGDIRAVADSIVVLQNAVLIGTGWLILRLVRQVSGRVRLAAAVYLGALLFHFHLSFQFTHDCWIVLLGLDLVLSGLLWFQPLQTRWRTGAWGLLGGFTALISPTVGSVWGVMSFAVSWRHGQPCRLALAVAMAMLTVSPWMVRNYLVFGRIIPIKSNLPYELYQSQVSEPAGVLGKGVFAKHPYRHSLEHEEFITLGETTYLDHKMEQFWRSVSHCPQEYVKRVTERFMAATIQYVSLEPDYELQRPWTVWIWRALHPIPFISLIILLASHWFKPLAFSQWLVIGVYLTYMLPYILISYYERYAYPLIVVQVPIIVWAFDSILNQFVRPPSAEAVPS